MQHLMRQLNLARITVGGGGSRRRATSSSAHSALQRDSQANQERGGGEKSVLTSNASTVWVVADAGKKDKDIHVDGHHTMKPTTTTLTSTTELDAMQDIAPPPPSITIGVSTSTIPVRVQESERLVAATLSYLCDLSRPLSNMIPEPSLANAFTGKRVPSIAMDQYVTRICKYVNRWLCEDDALTSQSSGFTTLAGGLVILERLRRITGFVISPMTAHRALLTCVVLAHKLIEDNNASNRYFAGVGGVFVTNLNQAELVVFQSLGFTLNISDDLERLKERFVEW